jgi:hypothetical protein
MIELVVIIILFPYNPVNELLKRFPQAYIQNQVVLFHNNKNWRIKNDFKKYANTHE